jgi:hypothetical protein
LPRVCEFNGISIWLYYDDHAPPHFHAIHGDDEAQIAIPGGQVLEGSLPRNLLRAVGEWTQGRGPELQRAWEQAMAHDAIDRIDP